jgi:hypothetical protein
VSLASVAPSVWHGGGGRVGAHARDPGSPAPVPAELADVIKYLGRVMPRSGQDPAAAAALLENLADRAL